MADLLYLRRVLWGALGCSSSAEHWIYKTFVQEMTGFTIPDDYPPTDGQIDRAIAWARDVLRGRGVAEIVPGSDEETRILRGEKV